MAQQRGQDLVPYGIKPAAPAALATQVVAYAASLPGYKLAVERGKTGGQTLRTTMRDLTRFVDDELRPAIELLAEDHPTAYAELKEALRIDDTGTRKKSKTIQPTAPGSTTT